jgi:hypothetical protein
VRKALLALAVTVAITGCGKEEPTPEQQVRQTLDDFGKATTNRDYQALCDRIFAPQLVDKLKQVGLPCEVALQQSLGDVKDPRISVGKVTVGGKLAKAEVRTSAAGQRPSQDTIELVPVGDTWRISSLG